MGELRGKTTFEIIERAGQPENKNGEVWIYRMKRDVPEGNLGNPRLVEIQLWFANDRLAHAWLHLVFADGLDYQEVVH